MIVKRLLILCLALALFAPSLDMLVCAGDQEIAPPMTAASAGHPAHEISHKLHDDHNDGDTVCVHGHCHHGFGAASLTVRPLLEVAVTRLELPARVYDAPPASLPNPLYRPPRA
jgi:hypothetical protein